MAFLYLGVPFIYGRFARLALKRKVERSNNLVLTFDDGPGTRLTTNILKILEEYDVKATFFVLGRNISGREEIVRQIAAAGHEIGTHGYEHLHYWRASPLRGLRSINQGVQVIDNVLGNGTGRGVYPFRPPYGKLDLICLLYLWIRKMPIVYWTLDLGDTWSTNRRDSQTVANWAKESRGAVVLAHDFDRPNDEEHDLVLDFVKRTLAMAKETNMHIMTCSQLMRY
jgi:peptidoglycan/xylan/chitin deacetylase (PgdA/CDA1 family)